MASAFGVSNLAQSNLIFRPGFALWSFAFHVRQDSVAIILTTSQRQENEKDHYSDECL
jgi:hypothetical protein